MSARMDRLEFYREAVDLGSTYKPDQLTIDDALNPEENQ